MRSISETAWGDSREGWLPRAIISGFVATGVMTGALLLAYAIAALLASTGPQASVLQQWLWGLTNNVVLEQVQTTVPIAILLHLLIGIGWAVVYALLVEPRLPGPGWRKGLLFAPLPWAASLVLFLPAIGGGFAGLGLGAGPLPIIGNLIVHLVYGVTLGLLYPAGSSRPLVEWGAPVDPNEVWTLRQAERSMAAGLVGGLILGGVLGWLGVELFATGGSPWIGTVIGAAIGGGFGALIASFFGLTTAR